MVSRLAGQSAKRRDVKCVGRNSISRSTAAVGCGRVFLYARDQPENCRLEQEHCRKHVNVCIMYAASYWRWYDNCSALPGGVEQSSPYCNVVILGMIIFGNYL